MAPSKDISWILVQLDVTKFKQMGMETKHVIFKTSLKNKEKSFSCPTWPVG